MLPGMAVEVLVLIRCGTHSQRRREDVAKYVLHWVEFSCKNKKGQQTDQGVVSR